ncbi:MAG: SGNH/GDSL hydrolase family protein [Phycisphaeraceae bacterium]
MKSLLKLTLLLLLVFTFAAPTLAADESAAKKNDPTKWEKTIAGFEAKDKESPPKKGGVLFIGSSSIRMWKLDSSFPDLGGLNRGFGGSQIEDSTYFADRIVMPYEPRLIVIYAGDNDLAAGKSPVTVAEDFRAFVKKVRAKLPKVKIAYIAIKPSIARLKLMDSVCQANQLIGKDCEADELLAFVDIASPMLGDDGKPREELFLKDGLHLNEEGYKVWTKVLLPFLK